MKKLSKTNHKLLQSNYFNSVITIPEVVERFGFKNKQELYKYVKANNIKRFIGNCFECGKTIEAHNRSELSSINFQYITLGYDGFDAAGERCLKCLKYFIKKQTINPHEPAPTTYVNDLETLFESIETHNLNPLEKQMAINLLQWGYGFYVQYKVSIPRAFNTSGNRYYVCDFVIPHEEGDLVIETEGKVHDQKEIVTRDRHKANTLQALGFTVLRFSWYEVMSSQATVKGLIDTLINTSRDFWMDRLEERINKHNGKAIITKQTEGKE